MGWGVGLWVVGLVCLVDGGWCEAGRFLVGGLLVEEWMYVCM